MPIAPILFDAHKEAEIIQKDLADQNREKEKILLTFSSLFMGGIFVLLARATSLNLIQLFLMTLLLFIFANCVMNCLFAYQRQGMIAHCLIVYLEKKQVKGQDVLLARFLKKKKKLTAEYNPGKYRKEAGISFLIGFALLGLFTYIFGIAGKI